MKKIFLNAQIVIFFLLIVYGISAQDTNPAGVEVNMTISSQRVNHGDMLTITLIIDYPIPDNIAIYVPSYSDFLSLDRLSVYARNLNTQQATSHTFTIAEYRFMAVKAGRFTLDSFIVVCPFGTIETRPASIEIIGSVVQTITPRIAWEGVSGGIITTAPGERITLTLRSENWGSPQPPPAFFMPQVPQGVILSSLPVSSIERTGGIILKMILIPLSEGEIIFPARTLTHNNFRFEIPALRIRVTP